MPAEIITFNSELYLTELKLRDKVLRKPLGMNLFDEDLSSEINDTHVGFIENGMLYGVLILTHIDSDTVKMRQVAIDPTKQNTGIGRQLVLFAEEYCRKKSYHQIVLNARKTAVGFYTKMGYLTQSDEFLEIKIPHIKMSKFLS